MKITAQDLAATQVIDTIIAEPVGGAHREPAKAIATIGDAIASTLAEFDGHSPADVRRQRHERFGDRPLARPLIRQSTRLQLRPAVHQNRVQVC